MRVLCMHANIVTLTLARYARQDTRNNTRQFGKFNVLVIARDGVIARLIGVAKGGVYCCLN